MFPHTITIFNIVKDNKEITYNRQIVENVFWYDKKIVSAEGKGEKLTSVNNVIFSDKALEKYLTPKKYLQMEDKTKVFTLNMNDIVVFGEHPQINDLKDIQTSNVKYFLIKTIADNRYGDLNMQNIEVTD